MKYCLLILLFLPPMCLGQNIEYGSPDELKGVSKIYIFTGTDLKARNSIAKEIQKKIENLVITDKPEDAEVCLIYAADVRTFLASVNSTSSTNESGTLRNDTYSGQRSTSTTTAPQYRKIEYGSGMVVKFKNADAVRLILDFSDSKSWKWERNPMTNFAKAFVKAYQKANE